MYGQPTDDGFLLVDAATQDIYELNETAQRIWELLTEGKSLDQIVDLLLDEYDASREQIQESVDEAIAELVDQGLVTKGG
jgi:hypothetical protein